MESSFDITGILFMHQPSSSRDFEIKLWQTNCSTTLVWFPHSLVRSLPPCHLPSFTQVVFTDSGGTRWAREFPLPKWPNLRVVEGKKCLGGMNWWFGLLFSFALIVFVSWKIFGYVNIRLFGQRMAFVRLIMLDLFGFKSLWYRSQCTSWAFLLMRYLMFEQPDSQHVDDPMVLSYRSILYHSQ